MTLRTKIALHCTDGKSKKTKFMYEARDNNPSDGAINNLVDAFRTISRLGVERATVTRDINISPSAAEDVDVRVADTANLKCHKSESSGGTYTFELVAVKDELVNPDGTLKITEAPFSNWCELFDDGAGLFGIQGNFTVSDGEALAENGATPTLPSGYTQISGQLDGKR